MEAQQNTSVFVYGTLKPGGLYHEAYCGRFRFEASKGSISGTLFDFPALGYPGALEHATNKVRGFLFTFYHPEQEVLTTFDELEGYDPRRPSFQNEYYRKKIPVYGDANQVIYPNAWCYFMESRKISILEGIQLLEGNWPV